MVSTFTNNLGFEEPANGDYPGTWGSAVVNPNMTIVDSALGGMNIVSLAAGSITLSTSQLRQSLLVFSGALLGNTVVTVPAVGVSTGISGRFFAIENLCTNTSLYTVVMQSTIVGSFAIGLPPGEFVDVAMLSLSGSFIYRSLARIGSYWDHAGSSVPNWVSACSVPPYLLCDGTTFSSATYPALANYLGGNTLPDARGRYRANLNSGTGRITSGTSLGGIDGNTILSSGGAQVVTLSSGNIPPLTVQPHNHGVHGANGVAAVNVGFSTPNTGTAWSSAQATSFGVTDNSSVLTTDSSGPLAFSLLPPSYIGGITMVRAG